MAEPQDTQPKPAEGNFDARVKAVEDYLASQEARSPASGKAPPSIAFAGGTIVHIPHVGSFAVTSTGTARACFTVLAIVLVGAVFLFARRHRHRRE